MDAPSPALVDRWFPLARGEEVMPRQVVQAQLLGQEIALWRDDAGRLNAWENRCPHRGVRFSIGLNDGQTLRCQYHGWRFESGSGQCRFIPAQPELVPTDAFRARTYPVREHRGFAWASLGRPPGEPPDLPEGAMTLRSLFVDAPAARLAALLGEAYGAVAADPFVLRGEGVLFLLQPVDEGRTVIHGLLAAAPADRRAALRHHNAVLCRLRDRAEAA